MIKKILLFLIPLIVSSLSVFLYFKLTDKISKINLITIPSVSFSDLVKYSRFSLDKAPSSSLVGEVVSMVGEVMFQGRLATESAKLNSLQKIQQGEDLLTGNDGNIKLVFNEAVELNIFPDSSVGVIQTLPANLVFVQKKGSVNYKKTGDFPVSIRSYHLLIENEGEVKITVDDQIPTLTVNVLNGKAKLAYNNLNNETRYLEINSGQKIIFNDDTRKVVSE